MHLRWTAGFLAAAAVAPAGQAMAQGVPANVGVADRFRPEYQPIGGRIGSFILYPRIDASVAIDDNIFATEEDTTGDAIFTVTPSVNLASQWQRNRLDLTARYTRNFYASNTRENSSTAEFNGSGVLDVSRQTQVRLSAVAGRFFESRTDINAITTTVSPTRFTRFGGRGTVDHQFTNLALTGEAGVQYLNFDNSRFLDGSVFDQSFRNSQYRDALVRVRYGFRGGASALVQISGDQLRYDEDLPTAPGQLPFDRASDGFKAEAGLALELASLLYGDVRIGYLRRDPADPTIRNVSGLSFGANLLWNVTPLTSLRLVANRSVEDSSTRIIAGNLRSEGTLTADHELLRNLILNGSLRYAVIDPIGPLSKSDEAEFRLGAQYLLNRRYSVNLTYRYYTRNSDVYSEFTSNRLVASVAARF